MSLPKVHLHCHLEGALRAATFLELAAKHGVATTYRPRHGDAFEGPPGTAPASPSDVYRFATFGEFLLTFAAVSRSLRDPEDYARLAREFAQDAIAQNVIYGELFISPSVWQFFHPDIDVRVCVEAIRSALDEAGGGVVFNLIVDLTRNFGVESAMRTARLAADLKDCDVIGIGLGGDEAKYPPELYVDAFAYARENGLHVVAHAGEAAGPQSIRDAIELLHVERIGHGVRALEDPSLVALLAQRKIPLEICPTSNFLTGAAVRERPHPFMELDRSGCIVTIDADDPALFGTTISAEYAYVAEQAGQATLVRLIGNAIDASFACAEHKAAMHDCLAAAAAELPADSRS
ncbi:MAG TPA: adenosine deaminase [Candidatus Baltobacteraceae bacterium]